jgi:hypothetical protein
VSVLFPLYVTGPDLKVHGFFSGTTVTWCGHECARWPCLLGGDVTCRDCLDVVAAGENYDAEEQT